MCVAFLVVGENVTLRNLQFDQSDCTPKQGYAYHQIPVICPGPSCAGGLFENLKLLNDQQQPLVGLLGATGVDGRQGATAVAEVDGRGFRSRM